jgi:hypothetical protein
MVSLVSPTAVCTLWTDASEYRWGAVLNDVSISGDFPEKVQS